VLIDGTAEGISQHVKAQFERGRLMVEKVRDIIYDLGENPDEFCPIAEGDKPWLVRLEALMHDTCNTAEAAAQSIIDEKGQKGIEFFGEEAWAALPVEARATFDVDCSNHTRQLASFQYRRMSKPLLESLLHDFQGEVRSQLGPCMRVELDSECLIRSLAKLLDTG
jgi:hypothetical protein